MSICKDTNVQSTVKSAEGYPNRKGRWKGQWRHWLYLIGRGSIKYPWSECILHKEYWRNLEIKGLEHEDVEMHLTPKCVVCRGRVRMFPMKDPISLQAI